MGSDGTRGFIPAGMSDILKDEERDSYFQMLK
jgi:hypothetical protein